MSHPATLPVMRRGTWTACAALAALLLPMAAVAGSLPPGFVYLRNIAPDIVQDMRYAGADNFTGHPLPGYDAAECVLRREVAEALAKVQADLAKQSLGLKVYDCYRPARAVLAFARWARQSEDGATKRFYPKMERRTLFNGYIAAHSAHSTGNAVDLTLISLSSPEPTTGHSRESGNPEPQIQTSNVIPGSPLARGRTLNEANAAPCTAPLGQRAPDNALDMGTSFDCLDPKSSALASTTTSAQNHARAILLEAMRKRGFRDYIREWWHFSYGARGPAYDFAIGPR